MSLSARAGIQIACRKARFEFTEVPFMVRQAHHERFFVGAQNFVTYILFDIQPVVWLTEKW